MNWIFGKVQNDLLWLHIPGLVALFLVFGLPITDAYLGGMLFILLAKGLFDSGHIAATFFRTYGIPAERSNKVYLWSPILIFLVFTLWMAFKIPGFWMFIIYSTLFHNFRQYYGVTRWYQKLNSRFDKVSDIFLHLLCLIPFIAFHFRNLKDLDLYFDAHVLYFYPQQTIFNFLVGLWVITFSCFLWREFKFATKTNHREWNRIISVLIPSLIYFFSFTFGETLAEIFIANVLGHGLAYIGLISLSMNKVSKTKFRRAVALTGLTALIWGSLVTIIEYGYLDQFTYQHLITESLPIQLAIALYLTPLFMHYFYDAFLWKSSHPQAKLIYSRHDS